MRRALALAFATLLSLPSVAQAEDPERVIMKLEEFLRLYETSKKPPEAPPRDHAIASARYRGEVLLDKDKPQAALFRAKMRIRGLKPKGWARVPILPATVALQSAKIGGREAPVVIEGGFYTLVTERRGDFDLDLVFGAAIETKEGSSAVAFQLAPSGATELQLSVPANEDLDFTVANAKLQSDKVVGGRRVVEATIPATGQLSVSWQREIPEAAKQKPRVYAEVYSLTSIGEGVMRATVTVHNTILFAGVDALQYQLPKGMTLLDVQGPGVRDWKAAADGKLGVSLNFAAEGAYSLKLEMERVVGETADKLVAPIVIPLGVERAKGWVGVESRGNLEVSSSVVKGATAVDVRSLPAAILGITDQPVLLGYKYLGAEPAVELAIAQHDEVDVLVTLVDQTTARTMWTREGRRLTSVTYVVRNNRRQFLRLQMPPGAELWSASVAGGAVQPAKASDGRVMIALVRSQRSGRALSAFAVEVVYVESGEAVGRSGRGAFSATLPIPDAPSTYVAWTVYSPEKTKVRKRTVAGNVRRVDYLSNPIPTHDLQYVNVPGPAKAQPQYQAGEDANVETARKISGASAMGSAAPVMVSLPLQGVETHFEKLLAADERLEVSFSYRGLRK